MSVRLYQIAKELNVPSKLIVAKCKQKGYDVKTHSSSISDEEAVALRRELTGLDQVPGLAPKKPKAKPKPKPKKEPKPKEKTKPKEEPKPPAAPASPPAEPAGKAAPAPPTARKEPEHKTVVRAPARREPPSKIEEVEEVVGKRPKPAHLRPRRKTAADEIEREEPPAAPAKKPKRHLRRWIAPGAGRRGIKTAKPALMPKVTEVEMEPPIVVKDISAKMGVKASDIIAKLMGHGIMATINETIDPEMAQAIGLEFGIEVKIKTPQDELDALFDEEKPDPPQSLKPRAPIVTFLGHVDHGKTSLLDRIRSTHVADGESGGITQHIGAYRLDQGDKHVVFLDTPGHESFTEMRARGANVTDVVVLVVATDDGIMPQTQEAISHARAAGVPIVVALNKMDLPSANPQRVKQQLSNVDLAPEEYGGKTQCVEVSAVTGEGVDDLVERLSLEAELLELKANPDKPARGTVLEAKLSEGRGVVATVLVKDGTLKTGDVFLCGHAYGRVRNMRDDKGRSLREAGPATPVEITGLSDVPGAGDSLYVLADAQKARSIAERRARKKREQERVTATHVTLETLFSHLEAAAVKELRVIVKADVAGSLEVIKKALDEIGTSEVQVNIIHSGVAGINLSDVVLADASDAVIIGFNVVADADAREETEKRGVDVRVYRVIYQLIDEVRQALEGMLEPEKRENVIGHAQVRQVFRVSRYGSIAGCYVTDGIIRRSSAVRLARESKIIYDGKIASLRRFKDDVREAREGYECGIKIEGFDDVKEGDVIVAYEIEEVKRTLEDSAAAPPKQG
ncbi:MAG: translation initiation factor IF-2 [Planctomycetes bacterium]|nr:translation initiation factor IF-2 [Planctomycetota bacterium]